ncbi:GNAT family N-acetyltransferase [Curtobacterium luteum]|uniref:GNAT family N-acetyltransferase n=1 Tax=Curtobacterium luteum TaxID=33881 RepID=UPI0038264A0F
MDPVTLPTDRLVLSAPAPSDAEDVIAYATDPDVIAYTPVPVPYGHAEAVEWLGRCRTGWESGTRLAWAIRRHEDPRLLGTVELFQIADGAAEVGYATHPDARGHGYVTEAVSAIVDWAFATPPHGLGLVRVQWRAIATNHASLAVARRVGMSYEGLRRSGVLHRGQRHDEALAAVLRDDDRSTPLGWPAPTGRPDA